MSLNGITSHARNNPEREFLTKREIAAAVKQGLIIKIPADNGRMAFCHTEKKVAVIADEGLSVIITYSPGGHFFKIIERVKEEIAAGRTSKKRLDREQLFVLKDGTKVIMNKKGTRIRKIFPAEQYRS